MTRSTALVAMGACLVGGVADVAALNLWAVPRALDNWRAQQPATAVVQQQAAQGVGAIATAPPVAPAAPRAATGEQPAPAAPRTATPAVDTPPAATGATGDVKAGDSDQGSAPVIARAEPPPPPAPPEPDDGRAPAAGSESSDADSVVLLFPTGDHALTDKARASLWRLARKLRGERGFTVQIDGHADPRGPEDFNRELARARARTVEDVLKSYRVGADEFVVESYGEDRPVVEGSTPDALRRNRRVEVRIKRGER